MVFYCFSILILFKKLRFLSHVKISHPPKTPCSSLYSCTTTPCKASKAPQIDSQSLLLESHEQKQPDSTTVTHDCTQAKIWMGIVIRSYGSGSWGSKERRLLPKGLYRNIETQLLSMLASGWHCSFYFEKEKERKSRWSQALSNQKSLKPSSKALSKKQALSTRDLQIRVKLWLRSRLKEKKERRWR